MRCMRGLELERGLEAWRAIGQHPGYDDPEPQRRERETAYT